MGSISVKLHREFSTRASRRTLETSGPPGDPLREMRILLESRQRQGLGARASAGVSRALRILFDLLLWLACFAAGALAFAYFSSRW